MSLFKRDWEKIPNDKLMYDLIQNYAKEGKDENEGKPNGKFFVDKSAARAVSVPYIDKYLHLSEKDDKKKFDTFMGTTFDELVEHYDPNGTGFIEVE